MTPLLALVVIAQNAESQIPGDLLLKDVDILERAYTAMHAGLYRYQSQAQSKAGFASLRMRLKNGTSLREAYLTFSEFAATIHCGHTYANFYNQETEVVRALFKGRNRVPFLFQWIGGRMVITRWVGELPSLPPGTEIQAINGISCKSIFSKLMKITRADGANDYKRRAYLNVEGNDKWEAFDIFLPLYYPSIANSVEVKFRRVSSTKSETLRVNLMTAEERLKAVKPPTDIDAQWQFLLDQNNIGHLRMPTWALYNSKWDWQTFLAKTFAQLTDSQAKGLIIDLRGNEGGIDVGDEILRYIVATRTEFSAMQRFTRYKKADLALNDYLDTWDRSFLDWGSDAKNPTFNPRGNAVFYRMTRFDDGASSNTVEVAKTRFAGKLVVLMNSDNSSATFQFEQKLQSHHLGTLVGEPSGGNLRGINGGAFFFLHLPNSHIEMDLPLVATLPISAQPDCGLLPDVAASPTRADIAQGRDRAMETAEALIVGAHKKS